MKKIVTICFATIAIAACNNKAKREAEILQAKQMTVDSIAKVEDVKKRTIDSMNAVAETKRVTIVHSSGNGNSGTTTTTTTTTKKGWNSTLKGAVIGAGAGAITGAMVDGKKGEGAIVGGLLGAGAGAGVGAIIDGNQKKKAKTKN